MAASLGFMLTHRDIKENLEKYQVVINMRSPKNVECWQNRKSLVKKVLMMKIATNHKANIGR